MVTIGTVKWGEFPLLLAPMEDVSDPPFRRLCKSHGVDMMYTEFISVEGLIRDADKSVRKLEIFKDEKPVGIQIFGAELDSMLKATDKVTEACPDVLDINFGCPVKKVVSKGAGAGILKDIDKMVRLTKAVVDRTSLPVTVKTRLGWDEKSIQIVEVAERLQDVGIQALSIHGRTRSQMYKGNADWTLIREVKKNPRMSIPIFGNGDVDSPQKAKLMRDEYGLDGCMIGRAAIGYPWIFNEIKYYLKTGNFLPPPSVKQRVEAVRKHLTWAVKWKGERIGIIETRKHYGNYFRGIPNFKPYKNKLLAANELMVLYQTLEEIYQLYN